MKKLIFYLAILIALSILFYAFVFNKDEIIEFQLIVYALVSVFFLIFGAYGLYAEMLWKKFRARGKTENLCVEANYFIQKKGFFARLFLFPFIKIKSSNSIVISFLGAVAWIIILSIVIKAIYG